MNNILSNHLIILNNIVKVFKKRLPEYSLAVSGSVARNDYSENSDIDLICFSEKITKIRRIVHFVNGIRVNLICFNVDLLHGKQYEHNLYIAYTPSIVPYILYSKEIIDIDNTIVITKEKIRSIVSYRKGFKSRMIISLNDKFENLLKIFRESTNDLIASRRLCIELIDTTIQLWFINNNIYFFKDKIEYLNIFETVKAKDRQFHTLVIKCLPIDLDNISKVKSLINYLQSARKRDDN